MRNPFKSDKEIIYYATEEVTKDPFRIPDHVSAEEVPEMAREIREARKFFDLAMHGVKVESVVPDSQES